MFQLPALNLVSLFLGRFRLPKVSATILSSATFVKCRAAKSCLHFLTASMTTVISSSMEGMKILLPINVLDMNAPDGR